MIKRIAFTVCILLFGIHCQGQSVQITGTVLDPTGKPYINGNGVVNLVPGNVQWLYGTNPVNTPIAIAQLDSFGKFSVSLTNTSLISPSNLNPQWQFSFCSNAALTGGSAICFTMTPMVLTSNQDISTQIQAQSAPLPTTGGSNFYQTVEASGIAVTQRPIINYIPGTNMSISCVDNSGQTRTDCTFTSTGGGSGNVTGPGSSTVNHIALFNNTTGTLLADSGVSFPLVNTNLQNSSVTVTAGAGLTGGGSVALGGSTTLSLLTSCSNGQVLSWNGSTWVCSSAGSGTVTGATSGGGLVLTSTTLGLLTSCSTNQILSWNGSAWVCTNSTGGNVSTTPIVSQNIVQPAGTQFSANNLSNIYYVTPSDNWSTTATVSSGVNVISLASCPRGLVAFSALNFPSNSAQTYVYISGVGTPEAALITASTCTQAGGTAGTITFTAVNSHGAGTALGSASQGAQEAINAATQTAPTYGQAGSVIIPPGTYTWQARVTVVAPYMNLNFAGSTITCLMSDTCLFIGSAANPNSIWDVTVTKFNGQPGCNNCNFPMIETAGQHTHFTDITTTNPNPVGSKTSGFSFGSMIQVDNDQSAVIDGLDTQQSRWSHCDTGFCSVAIKGAGGGGNAGILWIKNTNMNLGCSANGVDNQNANTMRISDSVIQSQAQFGVRSAGVFSNVPNVELDDVYFEVAGCANTNPLGIGEAGLIVENGFASVKNSVGPVGNSPLYANTGSTQYNYYIVAHCTGGSCGGGLVSSPLLAGIALTSGSGTIPVLWPQFGTAGTITYDVIRTSGPANTPAPYTAICTGGSTTTCGSVATGLTVGGACATVGTANICTFNDTASTSTASYTVASLPTYYPALGNGTGAGVFWPGSVIATQTADSVGSSASPSGVHFDRLGDNVSPTTVNPVSQLVTSWGTLVPRFFAQQCVNVNGGAWLSCLENSNASTVPGATVLNEGFPGAAATGLKGRVIIEQWPNDFGNIAGTHKITLVDSNGSKTLATGGMRPTWDASDTFIGLDNAATTSPTNAQLAFGAPVSISNYIGNVGNNTSYLERLTAALKTFNVNVQAPVFNATTGFQIGGAAPLNHCPVGNGTYYVDSSTCGSGGSLPSAPAGQTYYSAGGTTGATSNSPTKCEAFAGASLDVTMNACWAAVLTNLGGIADASGVNDASGLNENILSLVQTNQLLPPVLSKVSSGLGTAYGSSAVVTVSYALNSPKGTSSASTEASITVDATCPGSGNCFVQMASPTYFGSATTYTQYQNISTGYTGLACPNVSIGSTQAYGSGASGCNGTAVSKANTNGTFILPAAATWTCNFSGAACIQPMDRSVWKGQISGSTGGMKIVSGSSANYTDAMVGTDRLPKNAGGTLDNGQTYTSLDGFQITATNGTVPTAFRWSGQADSSMLGTIQVISGIGTVCSIYATGYSYGANLHCDGNNGAGGPDLVFGKIGANSSSMIFDNLVLVHSSNATSLLQYAGGSANLLINKLDEEGTLSAAPSNVLNDFGTGGNQLGIVSIGSLNIGAMGAGSTSTIVKLESTMNQFDIDELAVGGQSGVTPISDLRSVAFTATPFTYSQCSTASSQTGPCEYHVKRTPALFATGLNIYGPLGVTGLSTLTGGASIPSGATLTIQNGGTLTCATGSTCPNGLTGLITDGVVYGLSASTATSLSPPTANGTYVVTYPVTASAAVAPVASLPGVPFDVQSGASYTIVGSSSGSTSPATDRASLVQTTNNTTSTALTVPQAGSAGFGSNYPWLDCNTGTVVSTATPTTSTVNGNTTLKLLGAVAGHNLPCAMWWSDNTNWWAATFMPSDANGRLAAEAFPALTGPVTTSAGGLTTSIAAAQITNTMLVNSSIPINTVTCTLGSACTVNPVIAVTNASSTGTTVNTLTSLTGAPSTAVITTGAATGGVVGITISGAGTSGTASIQTAGQVSCVFSNATTAGDYVQISSTTGDCLDTGSTTYPTSGQVIGRVLVSNGTSPATNLMDLFGPEIKASSGGGTPCTTTANSLQYDNAGAFGCTTPFTFASSTITAAAAGIVDLSAATGAPALKLPQGVGGTILAGTVTAANSSPDVVQNTNSSNNNASITMGITSPGTSTGQVTLNLNGTTTQGNILNIGTGGTWASGVLSGQTIQFGVTPAGVLATYDGQATSGMGTAAQIGTASDVTGQSTSQTTVNLIASTAQAGNYKVRYYLDQNATCATPGPGQVLLTFNWTDATHAHSQNTIPLPFTSALTTAGGFIGGDVYLYSATASAISYTSTVTACTTGTATYDVHVQLEETK